jgi:hypothetical protein
VASAAVSFLGGLRESSTVASVPQRVAALSQLAAATAAVFDAVSGDLPALVSALGGEFVGPHLDPGRIAAAFAQCPDVDAVVAEAASGVDPPLRAGPVNNAARLARGNLPSAAEHPLPLLDRIVSEAADGRYLLLPKAYATQIPNVRVSSLGVVERHGKHRVISNLSSSGRMPDGSLDPSVNDLTDSDLIPPCDIAGAFPGFLARLYGLRQRYPQSHIVIQKVDVADAFRQAPVRIDKKAAGLSAYG